jgi:hypothetical protein
VAVGSGRFMVAVASSSSLVAVVQLGSILQVGYQVRSPLAVTALEALVQSTAYRRPTTRDAELALGALVAMVRRLVMLLVEFCAAAIFRVPAALCVQRCFRFRQLSPPSDKLPGQVTRRRRSCRVQLLCLPSSPLALSEASPLWRQSVQMLVAGTRRCMLVISPGTPCMMLAVSSAGSRGRRSVRSLDQLESCLSACAVRSSQCPLAATTAALRGRMRA